MDGQASKAFPGNLSFHWQQVAGPPVRLENRSSAIASFVAPDLESGLTFELVVKDAFGMVDVDRIDVRVRPRLSIHAEPRGGSEVALSSNRDASAGSHVWDLGDGRESHAAVLVHSYPGPGVYLIRLEVTDGQGAKDSATLEWVVGEPVVRQGVAWNPPEQGLGLTSLGGLCLAALLMGVACFVALAPRRVRRNPKT